MAKQPKVILAALSPEVAKAAAFATVKAVVSCEKSKRTLLTAVASAVTSIGEALSAAQYDRQFKPYLASGFERAVKRGDISQRTADQYGSKLKTAVLAILSKTAEPMAGETFWEFYDRAAEALPKATLANGAPVWEASSKRGRKVGAKVAPKGGSHDPAAAAILKEGGLSADKVEGGFDRSPAVAAALILCKGNEARAQRLVAILQSYTAEFDKWAATVLTDKDKAEIAERSRPQTPQPSQPENNSHVVTVKPGEAAEKLGAIGEKLVAAQARQNKKPKAA
jgi:hypothetical protein